MWLTWEMWGVSGLLLLGGELWTQTYVLLWPALGAFATALGAYLGLDEQGQLLMFSVSAVVLLALSRTVLKPWLFRERVRPATNVDAMSGAPAEVSTEVGDRFHPGAVRLNGEEWGAYTEDGRILGTGQACRVVRIDGLKLVVEQARAEHRSARNPEEA